MLQGLKFEASSLMNFVQIEIAIGIEIVLAVEVSFEVSFLFDPDFDFDFDLDCPASSLKVQQQSTQFPPPHLSAAPPPAHRHVPAEHQ
jgi:hypothetical protein